MVRRALIAGDSNHPLSCTWMEEFLRQNRWEAHVTLGEYATEQALERAKREGRPFDAFVATDVWLPLFTIDELALADARRLMGRDTHETGLRLCAFAKEHGVPAQNILCVDVMSDPDVVDQSQALGIRYVRAEYAGTGLRQLIEAAA